MRALDSARRVCLGVASLILVLVLNSCSGGSGWSDADPRNTPAPPPEATQAASREVVRTDLVGVDTAGLPSLSRSVTGMPNAVPRLDAPLPSLLDDLPGRAVVVVNPRISTLNWPVRDWSDLRLIFFGADGRWRQLSLADLGLSDSLTYPDTYGAGELSVDGRWWAGPTRDGMVALNLTTGVIRTFPTPHPGVAAWIPGRHSIVSSGEEFTVPGGLATRVPYDATQVGYERDGMPLSLERGPGGEALLVEWRGSTRHTRAVVPGISPPRRRIATDSARRVIPADQLTGVYPTQGQFAHDTVSRPGCSRRCSRELR